MVLRDTSTKTDYWYCQGALDLNISRSGGSPVPSQCRSRGSSLHRCCRSRAYSTLPRLVSCFLPSPTSCCRSLTSGTVPSASPCVISSRSIAMAPVIDTYNTDRVLVSPSVSGHFTSSLWHSVVLIKSTNSSDSSAQHCNRPLAYKYQ